ncbi:hypothetical protein ACWCXH_23605 [Kitasatospora sp. NPDC001660]
MGALNHPGAARILAGLALLVLLLLAIAVVALGALAVLRVPLRPNGDDLEPDHPTPHRRIPTA